MNIRFRYLAALIAPALLVTSCSGRTAPPPPTGLVGVAGVIVAIAAALFGTNRHRGLAGVTHTCRSERSLACALLFVATIFLRIPAARAESCISVQTRVVKGITNSCQFDPAKPVEIDWSITNNCNRAMRLTVALNGGENKSWGGPVRVLLPGKTWGGFGLVGSVDSFGCFANPPPDNPIEVTSAPACPEDQVWKNEQCECPRGATLGRSGRCMSCPTGYHLDASTEECRSDRPPPKNDDTVTSDPESRDSPEPPKQRDGTVTTGRSTSIPSSTAKGSTSNDSSTPVDRYMERQAAANAANDLRMNQTASAVVQMGSGGSNSLGTSWRVLFGIGLGFDAIPSIHNTSGPDVVSNSSTGLIYGMSTAPRFEFWPVYSPYFGIGGHAEASMAAVTLAGGSSYLIALEGGGRVFIGHDGYVGVLGIFDQGYRLGGYSDDGGGLIDATTTASTDYAFRRYGAALHICFSRQSEHDGDMRFCSAGLHLSGALEEPEYSTNAYPVVGAQFWWRKLLDVGVDLGWSYAPSGTAQYSGTIDDGWRIRFTLMMRWDWFGKPYFGKP